MKTASQLYLGDTVADMLRSVPLVTNWACPRVSVYAIEGALVVHPCLPIELTAGSLDEWMEKAFDLIQTRAERSFNRAARGLCEDGETDRYEIHQAHLRSTYVSQP